MIVRPSDHDWHYREPDWSFLLCTFLLQLAALLMAPLLTAGSSTRLNVVWPVTATLVAALLQVRREEWRWVAVPAILAPLLLSLLGANRWVEGGDLWRQQLTPLGTSIQIVEAVVLALWFEQFVPDRRLAHLQDALWFIAGLLGCSALAAFARLLWIPEIDNGPLGFAAGQRWFLADVLGHALAIPLVLGLSRSTTAIWRLPHIRRLLWEATAIAVGIAVYTLLVLNRARPDDFFVLRFPHWLYPFFLWSAIRLPLPLVSLHFAVAIAAALPALAVGEGAFGSVATTDNMAVFRFQAFFVLCLLGTLIAKAVLAQSEEANNRVQRHLDRLELILQDVNVAWWEWNFITNETRYSSRWYAQLGYQPDELSNEYNVWEERLHPADRPVALDYNTRYIQNPEPQYELEFRLRHRDGSYRWILSRGKLYHDEEGEPAWVRGIHIDITERVQSDARLREREAQLAHVSRLTTMGELVAGLAHELNQPLFAINNFAHASASMLDTSHELDRSQLRQWIGMIQQAVGQASSIIKRVRNYVRQGTVERRPTNLNDVVRAAFELIAFQARQNQVTVKWRLDPALPPLLGDPVQLEQIFVNLLRNACEAAAAAKPAEGRITVETRLDDENVIVTVDDNGAGIPPEERDEIFTPFKTSKAEGIGLGLPISRTLTEAHGGSLSVDTSPQGGARFIVRLPLVDKHRSEGDETPGVVSADGLE